MRWLKLPDFISIPLISDRNTTTFREKECGLFDDLWNMERYNYNVPSRSFCSNYCPSLPFHDNSNPQWFDCKRETMPEIEFVMGNGQHCYVVTSNGRNDVKNQICIQNVARYLNSSKSHDTKLVYLTHGYADHPWIHGNESWMQVTKDILLKRYGSSNIVVGVVNWEHGARGTFSRALGSKRDIYDLIYGLGLKSLPLVLCCAPGSLYRTAASSTWAIGNILAYLDNEITNKVLPKRINKFCIGHSLGGQLCGFFGKMVKILDPKFPVTKIIGLDPAGPIFEDKDKSGPQDPDLRLNKGDATNVEIFHTSRPLGFMDPAGDVDFYINGGNIQPECNPDTIKKHTQLECSHMFAIKLFNLLTKNELSCSANWKCKITVGSSLHDIKMENVTKLEHAGCSLQPEVTLGSLDQTNGYHEGVYWVEADEDSKTCKTLEETLKNSRKNILELLT